MFFAFLFVILSLVPVAGGSCGEPSQSMVDQFMHSEFLDSTSLVYPENYQQHFVSGVEVRHHRNPEGIGNGGNYDLQHAIDFQGRGIQCSAINAVYDFRTWNSFQVKMQAQFTVFQGKLGVVLYKFVQTSSDVDREPTHWTCLHHMQQIVLRKFLHDIKAYNILRDTNDRKHCLSSFANSIGRSKGGRIQHQSSVCCNITRCCCLTFADSISVGPKNEAAESQRHCRNDGGHTCVSLILIFTRQVHMPCITCYMIFDPCENRFINKKNHDHVVVLHDHVQVGKPYGCTQPFNPFSDMYQDVVFQYHHVMDVLRNPDSNHIEKSLVPDVKGNFTRVFSCNIRIKVHIQFKSNENVNITHLHHIIQTLMSFYHSSQSKNQSGLRQIFHESPVIINLFHNIAVIFRSTWSFGSILALWLVRVLSRQQRKVVILKRCKTVQGRRVWKKHRTKPCDQYLECFITVTTSVYYNAQWGPFNECLQQNRIIRCRISLPNQPHWNGGKVPKNQNRRQVCQTHPGCLKSVRKTPKLFRRTAFQGIRVGEAKVPGPATLDIGTFNPTQLYGKEEDIIAWGQGIYCAAETSATTVALKQLRQKFAQKGFYSAWSEPVEPIQPKFSQLRGKASGTAIISSFPIRQYHEPISNPIEDTSRFIDGVVQLGPNCVLYVASIYGVATSSMTIDSLAITNHLFSYAAERAITFKGPAVITGDLNCFLPELGGWDKLRQNGWTDAAALDGLLHNREPQPTSKDAVRKSFILLNGVLSSTLQTCRTCEDHLFPVHPLLLAKCSLPNVISPKLQWVLPKSVDGCMFDTALLENAALEFTRQHHDDFQRALQKSNEEAASWMAKAIEHSWKVSCVDSEGNLVKLTPGYFGRDRLQPLKYKPPSVPVVRKARDGDFDPGLGQPSVGIRRHTRQLRRLESLHSQLAAYNRKQTQEALRKCKQLWDAILNAPGFTKCFSHWTFVILAMFAPRNLPHLEYILELKNNFRKWHQSELNKFFLLKMKIRKKSVLLDIAKGGSKCFEEVKDPAPLPQSFVVQNLQLQVRYTAWPKTGKRYIYVYGADKLDINTPVSFQGQMCRILEIKGNIIQLDKPLRLKNLELILEQRQTTADPEEMHTRTFKAWNEHWQRDSKDPNDDDWEDVIPYLQDINPIPEMPFEDFSVQLWDQHTKAVKIKTARGGCGFSAKEMIGFPPPILEWLFEIFRSCEKHTSWPRNWVLARVSMLAKNAKPTTPFDARPITVFSILYRQWARVRSKQILQHMASYMPREISMATCRVPADVAAAYIATNVEDAINNNRQLAGLGIDLKRCFNTLPRWPLILAMNRMGVPKQYIQGWMNMLNDMQRTLWMGSCQSTPQHSTTGAPEGCGFSVVAMAVMSWWQSRTMRVQERSVETFTYADNWNYVAEQTRALIRAIDILKKFVKCMRLEISPSKSWLWATTNRGRRELRNIRVNHETTPVVSSFSDLGCDVQYARSVKKPQQKKRLDKATRLCKRVQTSKMPRGYKEHVVKASGLSGAIFGAPITYIPKTKWRTLRSNMAQSIRMATAGASSWLAMGCSLNDPQLKSLGHTLQFWKRFVRIFPNMKQVFENNMCGGGLSRVGPIACLKKTLRDAGWKVITHNEIQHCITGYQINWQVASRKFLWFVLERQWSYSVDKAVEHRKDWKPGAIDFHMYAKLTSHRSFRDKWVLRTTASGKHYTNDIISKYADVSTTCPFCDQRDSREHRLWSCSAFVDIRKKYTCTLRYLQTQTNNIATYALPPMQDSIARFIPWEALPETIHMPQVSDIDRFLFLDGTAFGQEYKDLTVSAWAVTEADFNQPNHRLCAKGFVPGLDHSSYRGEVVAILKGLDIIYRGSLYTDCEAALTIFEKLQSCRENQQCFPPIDHEDLWHLIWIHLCQRPPGCVRLHKVKSHQDEGLLEDPHEKWKAAGNNFTDVEAKSVVTQHPIHKHILKAIQKREQLLELTKSFHDYVCEVADKSFFLQKERRKCLRREAEQYMSRPSFSHLIPHNVRPSSPILEWNNLPRYCPYGETFYNRFAKWYATIRWPVDVQGGTLGYISQLELYFNFVLCTGTETPVSTAKRGKPAQYKLLDEQVLLQSKSWSLGQHTRVWCLFWNWCLKSGVFERPPVKTTNRCLEHVGYSLQSVCSEGRPALMHGEATYVSMWNYFHQPEGRRKTTAAPLRPLPKLDLTGSHLDDSGS